MSELMIHQRSLKSLTYAPRGPRGFIEPFNAGPTLAYTCFPLAVAWLSESLQSSMYMGTGLRDALQTTDQTITL